MVRSTGRTLLALVAACAGVCLLSPTFVPAPRAATVEFHGMVAASAAMPALTMLAEDAEAKYGDSRRWSAILVPLTTLVFPAVLFASFVLYAFSPDAFYQLIPGSEKSEAAKARWREHPYFENTEDPMNGLIDKDDFEKGLEEAWEKAKPAGSSITVQAKLKELSEQNNPHWYQNKAGKALSA
mmetsp:Transcript_65523/g.168630  ORF Transcript_65523/g.168630 Transcript_65523/m.168630 type:complete len:183 (-) Transcript_65523:271-819(-)